jgi:hypothetical protein
MRRTALRTALGLAALLALAPVAGAQTNSLNSFGGYPTPLPYNSAPGSYTVAPSMPGSGGSYAYVQQTTPGGWGQSPNAYYSANFFTSTPMTPNLGNAAGYAGTSYPSPSGYTYPGTYNSYYAAPGTGYTYGTSYPYATTRRVGPIRRMFGGWR